jgi:hypothetical protein
MLSRLVERTEKSISRGTLRRTLRAFGFRWKRLGRSLKKRRDSEAFALATAELDEIATNDKVHPAVAVIDSLADQKVPSSEVNQCTPGRSSPRSVSVPSQPVSRLSPRVAFRSAKVARTQRTSHHRLRPRKMFRWVISYFCFLGPFWGPRELWGRCALLPRS